MILTIKKTTLIIPRNSCALFKGNRANGIIICQMEVNVAPIDAQDNISKVFIYIFDLKFTLSYFVSVISLGISAIRFLDSDIIFIFFYYQKYYFF